MSDPIQDYYSESRVLIAQKSGSAQQVLADQLQRLGVRRERIQFAFTPQEALALLEQTHPDLIFCDEQLGSRADFELARCRRGVYSFEATLRSLFIVVTKNASQSAVAHAAEEEADAYIIKPFTLEGIKRILGEVVLAKIRPSHYRQKIENGRKFLLSGKVEPAIAEFTAALKLDDHPGLACYYLAQAVLKNPTEPSSLAEAEKLYWQGLNHSPLHFRCLRGLHDLLLAQKRHDEAYEVLRLIVEYFPLGSQRLSSVLRLAVATDHFTDIVGFYDLYRVLPDRNDETSRYVASAMLVAGKWSLTQRKYSLALQIFDEIVFAFPDRAVYIKYIVDALGRYGQGIHADRYAKNKTI
jgi:CheY-like chemotaxis protein